LPEASPASGAGDARESPAPETALAQVRFLYEDTPLPVRMIATQYGISERAIYRAVRRLGWRRRGSKLMRPGSRTALPLDRGVPPSLAAEDAARGFLALPPSDFAALEAARAARERQLWASAQQVLEALQAGRADAARTKETRAHVRALNALARAMQAMHPPAPPARKPGRSAGERWRHPFDPPPAERRARREPDADKHLAAATVPRATQK
jgi:hypothetical protein